MITTFERRKLSPPGTGSVVSIGMFDGVHLGHQAILADNVAAARELGAVPTVVTFRRHPKKLLLGQAISRNVGGSERVSFRQHKGHPFCPQVFTLEP